MLPRCLVVVAVCVAAASTASARDLYVNNVEGDDSRDGSAAALYGQRGGPCRTIARALRVAKNGDRIILANTGLAYRESITLQADRNSGIPNRPFVIEGNGAMLDGSQPVPKDAWEYHGDGVFLYRPPRMSFQILYLNGKPASRRKVESPDQLPELEPLEWCLFQRALYFRVEESKLPRQYDLSYTALPVGVTLYEVRNVILRDLVVQGYQLDGVNAHDGVFDANLIGLTCRGNGRSGISVGGASRVNIFTCLVGDNGLAQIRTEGFSRTQISDCDLLENTAPAVVRDGGAVTMLADGETP